MKKKKKTLHIIHDCSTIQTVSILSILTNNSNFTYFDCNKVINCKIYLIKNGIIILGLLEIKTDLSIIKYIYFLIILIS